MEQLLTIKEAAEYLNIHWQTVRKYISEGQLKSVKVGNNVRLTKSEIEKFIGLTDKSNNDIEIERKYIIDNRKQLEKKLLELDVKITFHAHVIDHYFLPNKIKSKERQATWFKGKDGYSLRIRETDNDYSGYIVTTMVAKKLTQANDHGIHEEIEIPVHDYNSTKALLKLMGLKEYVVVDKDRVMYSHKELKICIDEIKDAGVGVEIEYKGKIKEEKALEMINEMAKKLNLDDKDLSEKGISYVPFIKNTVY